MVVEVLGMAVQAAAAVRTSGFDIFQKWSMKRTSRVTEVVAATFIH